MRKCLYKKFLLNKDYELFVLKLVAYSGWNVASKA